MLLIISLLLLLFFVWLRLKEGGDVELHHQQHNKQPAGGQEIGCLPSETDTSINEKKDFVFGHSIDLSIFFLIAGENLVSKSPLQVQATGKRKGHGWTKSTQSGENLKWLPRIEIE